MRKDGNGMDMNSFQWTRDPKRCAMQNDRLEITTLPHTDLWRRTWDGVHFRRMRIRHMQKGNGKIRFGICACSPEEPSFTAVFTDMRLTECAWKAHDGQPPDDETPVFPQV